MSMQVSAGLDAVLFDGRIVDGFQSDELPRMQKEALVLLWLLACVHAGVCGWPDVLQSEPLVRLGASIGLCSEGSL